MVLMIKEKMRRTLRDEVNQLLQQKVFQHKKHAWNKFFGKVKFTATPVSYQRNLRDE
jgi:hypothetical protein